MRRAVLALPFAAIAVILARCSGVSQVPSADDAAATYAPPTKDSGARRPDTGIPSASDAHDGPAPVAPPDSGAFVGVWNPIPGVTACSLRIAADPAASMPTWTWDPCPSGRTGCRVLHVDWAPPDRWAFLIRDPGARLVGGRPYVMYERVYPIGPPSLKNFSAAIDVLQPLDGPPVFAIGGPIQGPDTCSEAASFGEYGVGFVAYVAADPSTRVLGWSAWATPTSVTTAVVSRSDLGILANGGVAQGTAVGKDDLFVRTFAPLSVAVFDIGTRSMIARAAASIPAEQPDAVPDGAFVLDGNFPYAIALLKNDGTYARVVEPTAPHLVTWMTVDRSNANAIVWIESDDQGVYVNPVLWTAPYATTAGAVQRTKVAMIAESVHTGGRGMIANHGVALNVVTSDTALLTRLSDGAGWRITSEPGRRFVRPLWVDDDEAWIVTEPDVLDMRVRTESCASLEPHSEYPR